MSERKLTDKELLSLTEELMEHEVLEFVPSREDPDTLYIPYMMNDAVEYYLILRNVRITGDLPEDLPPGASVRTALQDGRQGLLFDLPGCGKPALWFDECTSSCAFYQYHRIGHFWRKGAGHWRMLVYMIGTIHDKYTFLGPEAVNGAELSLLPLVRFGPFRAFSPVEESLEEMYPDGEEGWTCMRSLALEAGDTDYVRRIDHARFLIRLPFADRKHLEQGLEDALLEKGRRKLFLHIYNKVCRASLPYRERLYAPAAEEAARKAREAVSAAMARRGFAGSYPRFTKGDDLALALEEHPFTVEEIDYEGFSFGIRIMLWEGNASCPRILNPGDLQD